LLQISLIVHFGILTHATEITFSDFLPLVLLLYGDFWSTNSSCYLKHFTKLYILFLDDAAWTFFAQWCGNYPKSNMFHHKDFF